MTTVLIACAAALAATAFSPSSFSTCAETRRRPSRSDRGSFNDRMEEMVRRCRGARSRPGSASGARVLQRALELDRPRRGADPHARDRRLLPRRRRRARLDRRRIGTGGRGLARHGTRRVTGTGCCRSAGRQQAASDLGRVRVRPRGQLGRGDPRRHLRPAAERRRADRLPRRVHPRDPAPVRRGAGAPTRGARASRRPGDPERAPLPRGTPARRSGRAHRVAQPALLPRNARPRGLRARSATRGASPSSSSTSTTSRR